MPSQTQFSRHVLKWLQQLELSYTFLNPRRDFANGYLVAEILSKHQFQSCNCHSSSTLDMNGYLNEQCSKTRLDNWMRLNKFCVRNGIDLNSTLTMNVMNEKSGTAIDLITKLYEILQDAPVMEVSIKESAPVKLPSTAELKTHSAMNHHLQNTASYMIRESLTPSVTLVEKDLKRLQQRALEIVKNKKLAANESLK